MTYGAAAAAAAEMGEVRKMVDGPLMVVVAELALPPLERLALAALPDTVATAGDQSTPPERRPEVAGPAVGRAASGLVAKSVSQWLGNRIMIVTRGYSTNPSRDLLDPVLEKHWSFFFELRGGDVVRPRDGNWLKPPFPKKVWRWFCRRNLLPFIAWSFSGRAGYLGFKAFSADGREYPQYLEWMPLEDTGPGSVALTPSFRPFADMRKQ